MGLAEAIKDALGGRTQASLAAQVGLDGGRLSRILSGKVDPGSITLELIVALEDALELRRGALLIAAGYVEGVTTAEEAIEMEPGLSRDTRDALIGALRNVRRGRR